MTESARPTVLSLYSGAGGLDKGFVEAGFDCLWANDIDEDAVATYVKNLGSEAVQGDVGATRLTVPARSSVDVVIGGPPCQGFSVAGHMKPDDPRSRHVWTFLDVVRELRPRVFVMENVAALAINRRWSALMDELRRYAARRGYETQIWVLNASHFEVPQARVRMFLVGSRVGPINAPVPVTAEKPPTVGDALRQLPAYGSPGNDTPCLAKVTPAKKPVMRRSPFAGMLFNGKGRPLALDAPAPTLAATMGGNRTPIIDQAQMEGSAEQCWIIDYHEHLSNGGKPYDAIPPRMRRLTVEEAAAIQTFPPGWEFTGRTNSRFRQIGNAVPPRLAFHVATPVLSAVKSHQREGLVRVESNQPTLDESVTADRRSGARTGAVSV